VIITAGTSSNQPMELAIKIARKKGKVVVVGAVGMNIARSPFYEKELNLTISCSYGPGRYDPLYEEKGIDYPIAYARWTENRNMQSFLTLIEKGKIFPSKLTSHRFEFQNAAEAYKLITSKEKPFFLGILLDYPQKETTVKRTYQLQSAHKLSQINIAFIGAGNFAQSHLLPHLKIKGVSLSAVSNANPSNSLAVAKNFGFQSYSSDGIELINRNDLNCVFVATRHDTHYQFVIESIKARKPVFVEKPLAIDSEQLDDIRNHLEKQGGKVMVGFNRRFSKPFQEMKKFFSQRTQPLSIIYRVNAGFIPNTSWVCQPEHGGRIIGEVCHFIDCMVFLTNAMPVQIFAQAISSSNSAALNQDTVSIQIKFSDGSIGTINYFANGDSSFPKEYCECFSEQSIAIMNNFSSLELYKGGRAKKMKFDGKKGHKEEIEATIKAIKQGGDMPISFKEIYAVTKTTFLAVQSIEKGSVIPYN
jgi:polar amino acid transport system substrate-binding protein